MEGAVFAHFKSLELWGEVGKQERSGSFLHLMATRLFLWIEAAKARPPWGRRRRRRRTDGIANVQTRESSLGKIPFWLWKTRRRRPTLLGHPAAGRGCERLGGCNRRRNAEDLQQLGVVLLLLLLLLQLLLPTRVVAEAAAKGRETTASEPRSINRKNWVSGFLK